MQKGKYPPFTPLLDWVAKEVGTVAAITYGVVRRHCEMWHGKCYASMKTMSELTQLSRKTTWRNLKKLVSMGLLRDMTPDAVGVPHHFLYVSEGEYRRMKNGVNVCKSVDIESIPVDTESQGVVIESKGVDTESTKETIRYNKKQEETNPDSQKNENPVRSRAANYVNKDAMSAYRNITRQRLLEEGSALIDGTVEDVAKWQGVLLRAKRAKWDLADIPALLVEYESSHVGTAR